MSAGETHKVPQSPAEAIIQQRLWIEQGFKALEELLAKYAAFTLYCEGVNDEPDTE